MTPTPATATQPTPAPANQTPAALIEDWLLPAGDDARADLAGYLDGSGHGTLAAGGLITAVGHAYIALHRRLRKATR